MESEHMGGVDSRKRQIDWVFVQFNWRFDRTIATQSGCIIAVGSDPWVELWVFIADKMGG